MARLQAEQGRLPAAVKGSHLGRAYSWEGLQRTFGARYDPTRDLLVDFDDLKRELHLGEVAVVNASPLIYLSSVGRLDLLRPAAPEILVPDAVAVELRRSGDDPAAQALDTVAWLKVVATPSIPPSIQAWDLGPGEAAVLALAVAHGETAIVDDLAARRCAAAHRIPVRGTLGLVLAAKQAGRIPAAGPWSSNCARLACIYPTP